ncbi:MAG: ferredoxin [Kiritimatiellae bacterium]|nr:ferredoxin [Kiritimatiellia bacterium]MCO5067195.1 ferredoxin [Kiritimatiellia bacterium]
MKTRIDESACTGCGVCGDTAPDVFEMGDDMIAKVKVEAVPAGSEEAVREAASNCPVTCIEVEE